MARNRRIAAAAVAGLSLALAPAAAHAQNGAGDQQYQDPFAGGGQTQTTPKAQRPSAPLSQAPPATSAPSAPAPQAVTATAAPAAQGQLPRTGLDVRLVGAAGLVLLLAGLALRLRLTDGRR